MKAISQVQLAAALFQVKFLELDFGPDQEAILKIQFQELLGGASCVSPFICQAGLWHTYTNMHYQS